MTTSLPRAKTTAGDPPAAGPGHFSAHDVQLPLPGEWRVDIAAFPDQFTEANATDTRCIRG